MCRSRLRPTMLRVKGQVCRSEWLDISLTQFSTASKNATQLRRFSTESDPEMQWLAFANDICAAISTRFWMQITSYSFSLIQDCVMPFTFWHTCQSLSCLEKKWKYLCQYKLLAIVAPVLSLRCRVRCAQIVARTPRSRLNNRCWNFVSVGLLLPTRFPVSVSDRALLLTKCFVGLVGTE